MACLYVINYFCYMENYNVNILLSFTVTLPPEGSVRVYDWYNVSNPTQVNVAKGAIEIFHNGYWGAICSTNADDNIAVIACKQLGYTVGYSRSFCCDHNSPSRKFWVTRMTCFGNETKVTNCSYAYGMDTTSCFSRYRVECVSK